MFSKCSRCAYSVCSYADKSFGVGSYEDAVDPSVLQRTSACYQDKCSQQRPSLPYEGSWSFTAEGRAILRYPFLFNALIVCIVSFIPLLIVHRLSFRTLNVGCHVIYSGTSLLINQSNFFIEIMISETIKQFRVEQGSSITFSQGPKV